MCLITYQKEPIILEEDLIVYKDLIIKNNFIYSRFFSMVYELNTLYTTKIASAKGNDICFYDRDARLAYLTTYEMIGDWNDNPFTPEQFIGKYNLNSIGSGFHSILDGMNGYRPVNFKCKIPKGSEVYYDNSGLVASNQIIILGRI